MKKVFKCGIPLFYLILLACMNIIESENVVLSVKGIKDLRKKKEMKKMLKARLANNCISGKPEPIWEDDVITETFCRCNDGTYGLTCLESFLNPCVNMRQYASADNSIAPNYFIECTANIPYLMKCAPGTKWNEKIVTCDWDYNTKRYENYKKGNPVEVSKKQLKNNYEERNKGHGYGYLIQQNREKEGNEQEPYKGRKDEWEQKQPTNSNQGGKYLYENKSEKYKTESESEQYMPQAQENEYIKKSGESGNRILEVMDKKEGLSESSNQKEVTKDKHKKENYKEENSKGIENSMYGNSQLKEDEELNKNQINQIESEYERGKQVLGNQEYGGLSGYEIPKGQIYDSQGSQASGIASGHGGKINGVASGGAGNFDGQIGSMNDAGSGYQQQPVYGNQEYGGLSGYEIPKSQIYASQGSQASGIASGHGKKINGVASGSAVNFDGQKGSMNDAGSGYQQQQVSGNQEYGGLSGYEIPKGQIYDSQGSQASGIASGHGGKINGVASGSAVNFDGQIGSMNDAGSGYLQQPVYVNQEYGGKISGLDSSNGSLFSIQKPTDSVNDYSKLSPELKKKIDEIKYSFLNEKGSSKFSSKDIVSVYDSSSMPNDYASSIISPNSNENSVFDAIKNTFSNSNPSEGGYDSSIQNIYEAFVKNKIENSQNSNKSKDLVHTSNSENPIEYIKNVISNAQNKSTLDSYQKSLISSDLGNQQIILESDYSELNQIPITKPNYQPKYGQDIINQIGGPDQDYKSQKYLVQEQNKSHYKPVETNYPKTGEKSANFVSQEKVAFQNNKLNDIMNDASAYQTPQVHGNKGTYENEASKDQAYISQGGLYPGADVSNDGPKESVDSSPVQGYQPILSDKNANYQLKVDSSKLSVQETDKLLKFLIPKITSTQMGHQQFFKIDIPIDKNSQAYCKDSPNGVTIGLSLSFF